MIEIVATIVSCTILFLAIWEWCMCLDKNMSNWYCRVGMFLISAILVANLIIKYYL